MPDALVVSAENADFRKLLLTTLPHLRAYARSLTRSADQADDLVQDTAVRLLEAQDRYRRGTDFRAWAFTILRNRFIDIRRRVKFYSCSIEDIDMSLFEQSQTQESAVYFEQIKREFRRLSQTSRKIITMIGVNEMTYVQAAKILRIPVGTVRSRIARARAFLWYEVEGIPIKRDTWGNVITRRKK